MAILALGNFFDLGTTVKEELKKEAGIYATLINPRYITGVDAEMLEKLASDHRLVVTLEDGALDGGFGEKIARFYGNAAMKVLNFGAQKEFVDSVTVEELHERYHLTEDAIISDILEVL